MERSGEIRGVTIQISEAKLLLPNATVAEVITYGDPSPIEGSSDWLMGEISWRGWRLPLFSFSRLAGITDEEATIGAKIAIIKALSKIPRLPYSALLTQGFPRLTTVRPDNLEVEEDTLEIDDGIRYRVRINEEDAVIPDLEWVEAQLAAETQVEA